MLRIGNGYDVHQLVEGRPLIIGGVKVEHDKGLLGHSDADVLTHAIMDALIGAMGEGDIGKHFPDTDIRYKGISSIVLLKYVKELLDRKHAVINNIDATIIAQKPKMLPYIERMKKTISDSLEISLSQINIKATTEEKLGFTGEEKGIASQAVVLIDMKDNV